MIDASPVRLRAAFGRCEDAERAQLRDMRIEKNRLAAITRSDRAMRRHVIEMAKLERQLEGVVFRLTARVHDKKKAVPTKRRKRPDVAPVRRLPRMGIPIVDRAGRLGILVEVTSVGASQPRYRPGCCRLHLAYIWAENAVERLASGELSRCSNMGPTAELIAAAMDLKEDVARASRANANIEIRIIIRLPDDISPDARLQILSEVCETFFGRNGLPYAAAVHPPDPHSDRRNYHGHIQAGFRPMGHVGGSEWEVGTELRTDLSRPDGMRLLRAIVADTMTEVCRKEGRQRTYTSLSNAERGLTMKPLKKVGREQTEAYRRGEYVGVVEENARIIADNLKRYAKQRMAWLKAAMLGLREPAVPAIDARLGGSDPPALAPPPTTAQLADAPKDRRLAAPVIPVRIGPEVGRGNASLSSPELVRISRSALSMAGRAMLNAPPVMVSAHVDRLLTSRFPERLRSPAMVSPVQKFSPRPAVSKPPLPVPAQSRAAVAGIDDALLLLQLRAAQKQDREAFEKRRRVALDRHLFQRGDSVRPTPEYGAFLLAIRNDPALLRWALDPGGKRRAPVLAGGDEAFQDRFATYMQHPAVQQQVTALLERAYEPGKPWPDELAHGMWRYEPGRYGHQSAVEARAGWTTDDARIQPTVAPWDTRAPIIERAGDLVVPDIRRVLRWGDADLVRLLYPSVQRDLTVLWREQQEERVEALVAIADGTVSLERRLVPDGDTLRPTVTPSAVPPALAAAFARWQDDPDFYLDMALDSAAARAAVKRKANCSDPHRRAVEASRIAGDAPAVQRALTERSRDHERFASQKDGQETPPKPSPPARRFPAVRSGKKAGPRGPSPRRS